MNEFVDIITLSCARNYGAMLQTYALFDFLQKTGYQVKVLNYITERYDIDNRNYRRRAIKDHKIFDKNFTTRFLWRVTYYRQELKARDVFQTFLNKHVKMSAPCYNNNDLKKEEADIFITGSDQIWNSDFTWDKKIDSPYFLAFVDPKKRKISYSSSFGKSELNDGEKDDVLHYLSDFEHLSVREQSGKNILQSLGLNAEVVADPTLLLNIDEWNEIASERIEKSPYTLLFQITPNKEFMKYASSYAAQHNTKLVIVSPEGMHRIKIHQKAVYLPKVEDWVSYIKYADYILTDSFHAMVFSVIYRKRFTVGSFAGYNSRILDFLEVMHLENRIINNCDLRQNRYKDDDIDYAGVDKLKDDFILKSKGWLLSALKSE